MAKKKCSICGGKIVRKQCIKCGNSENYEMKNNNTKETIQRSDAKETIQRSDAKETINKKVSKIYKIDIKNGESIENQIDLSKYMDGKKHSTFSVTSSNVDITGKFNKIFILICVVIVVIFLISTSFTYITSGRSTRGEYYEKNASGEELTMYIDIAKEKYTHKNMEEVIIGTGDKYSATLEAGYYIVGVDIPAGVYSGKINSDEFNFEVDGTDNNMDFSSYSRYTDKENVKNVEFQNIYLFQGATVKVKNKEAIILTTENAQMDTMKVPEPNTAMQSYIPEDMDITGIDFLPGTYDVKLIDIESSGDYIKIEGYSCDDSTLYAFDEEPTTYKNINFKKGQRISLNGVEATLTRSEYTPIKTE